MPDRGLRQIVGAEAEEFGHFGDLIGGQRAARNLDHGADQVLQVLHAGLFENFFGHALDDLLLDCRTPLDTANQRDHDFGNHLDALLGHLHGGFEDGAGLHFGDFGIGDAEAAAAMTRAWD